jgi:DNA-binding transcriptional ArsR family regulator
MCPSDEVFAAVAEYFRILAEPSRLKILQSLFDQERSVNEVMDAVNLSQANVSRHLSHLFKAGLVGRRKQGNAVLYRLNDPAVLDLCGMACKRIAARIDDRQPLRNGLLGLLPTTAGTDPPVE